MTPTKLDMPRNTILQLSLLSGLDDSDLDVLLPGIREFKAEPNEMLFQSGEHLHGIYVLKTGEVKLFLPTTKGTDKIVGMIHEGNSFGEASVFNEMPCPVSAQTTKESTILIINKKVLLEELDRNPLFARRVISNMALRMHDMMLEIESCMQTSSIQKVMCYLSQQISNAKTSPIEFKLDSSKQVLASRLNLAPETLSRVLHHLSETGLIEMEGRLIRIKDIQRIRQHQS